MQEFKGLKLTDRIPYANWALIFWTGDEPSQSLEFKEAQKCDKILAEIIEGNGVKVKYDFNNNEETTVYPHRVIKVKFTNEYALSEEDIEKLREEGKFTEDIEFPETIGKNKYQPLQPIRG